MGQKLFSQVLIASDYLTDLLFNALLDEVHGSDGDLLLRDDGSWLAGWSHLTEDTFPELFLLSAVENLVHGLLEGIALTFNGQIIKLPLPELLEILIKIVKQVRILFL